MPIEIGDKSYYTVEDIHEKTGIHIRTIRIMLKEGRLRGKKQGKRWYVPEKNLQDFFDGETQGNK
jgi:excisionase family DNA binding protein